MECNAQNNKSISVRFCDLVLLKPALFMCDKLVFKQETVKLYPVEQVFVVCKEVRLTSGRTIRVVADAAKPSVCCTSRRKLFGGMNIIKLRHQNVKNVLFYYVDSFSLLSCVTRFLGVFLSYYVTVT
jgi:hypothetical protein